MQGAERAGVGDDDQIAIGVLACHRFVPSRDACMKHREGLTPRWRLVHPVTHPTLHRFAIVPLDLVPSHSFPAAEIEFAEAWVDGDGNLPMVGPSLRGFSGASQVTAMNAYRIGSRDSLSQRVDGRHRIASERHVAVADACRRRHAGLGMSNQQPSAFSARLSMVPVVWFGPAGYVAHDLLKIHGSLQSVSDYRQRHIDR
jgi:hypothetical protein